MAFLLWWVADLEHPTTYTFGETPKLFAACRYAGQDGILRRLGKPPTRRVNNPPQVDNLPHNLRKFMLKPVPR